MHAVSGLRPACAGVRRPGLCVALFAPPSLDATRHHTPQVKERQGAISRIAPDGCSAVCKGLFKRESDLSFFEGAKVVTGRGEVGTIQVRVCCVCA
jgi:hypothetical protein